MTEIGIYFFKKKKSGKFNILRIPISENESLLDETIEAGHQELNNLPNIDYLSHLGQRFSEVSSLTIPQANISQKLTDLARDIILNNNIESIENYSHRANAKDAYPFSGIAILKKSVDGTFKIGIESFSESLKLYRKEFWIFKLGNDYKVEPTNSIFLIPKKISIILTGTWDASNIIINQAFCKSNETSFLGGMFSYREHLITEANKKIKEQNYLNIPEQIWREYSSNLWNVKKFLRIHSNENILQQGLSIVKQYYSKPGMPKKLGFTLTETNGQINIQIQSQEQMKLLMNALQRHIFQDIIEPERIVIAENPEHISTQ